MESTPMDAVLAGEALGGAPPPLFEQTNVRKPEYWQFARLIAPSAALPPSKKHWTADDAVGIWCLKCHKALVFQKGSSQSIRYHMETKHRIELEAFRDHGKAEGASTPGRASKKRKTSGDADDDESDTTAMTSSANDHERADWTWSRNLERRGGFWRNASWYDVHLERRLPLAKPMLEELVAALPPCDNKHVLDLLAGSGRATEALVAAYPTAFVTLVDASVERLSLAKQRLLNRGVRLADEQFLPVQLTPETLATASPVPVDVVLGCLALHVLAENPVHYQTTPAPPGTSNGPETTSKEAVYEQLFRGVWALLKPGGHFLLGDHVGQLPLFTQLRLLHRVGFVDVDCAWRQTDFFVAGARKPLA